jgi:predicted acylesterase/phospholipase RssA
MSVQTALVLSGGGLHGPFHVGAVDYLYRRGVRPNLIAGTSAGALVGAILAESPSTNAPAAIEALKAQWNQIRTPGQVYRLQPWLAQTEEVIQWLYTSAPTLLSPRVLDSQPLFLVAHLVQVGIAVGGELSKLDKAWESAQSADSLLDPSPAFEQLDDPSKFDPEKVANNPDIEFYVSVVSLRTGELHYVDKNGNMLDRSLQRTGAHVGLVAGIKASASLPIAFPPTMLGDEPHTDGGNRANIPTGPAFIRGAQQTFVVSTSKAGLPLDQSRPTLPSIATRVPDLMLDELADFQFQAVKSVHAIRPTIDLPSNLIVDPGLISIYMDYGFMSAYDWIDAAELVPGVHAYADMSAGIIQSRINCWEFEFDACARTPASPVAFPKPPNHTGLITVPAAKDYRQVRELKREIFMKTSVRAALGGALPQDCEQWWTEWERHTWDPITISPWQGETFNDGETVPAERPPALAFNVIVDGVAGHAIGETADITARVFDNATSLPVLAAQIFVDGKLERVFDPFSWTFTKPHTPYVVQAPHYPDTAGGFNVSAVLSTVVIYDPNVKPPKLDQQVSVTIRAFAGPTEVTNGLAVLQNPREQPVSIPLGQSEPFVFRAMEANDLTLYPYCYVTALGYDTSPVDLGFPRIKIPRPWLNSFAHLRSI